VTLVGFEWILLLIGSLLVVYYFALRGAAPLAPPPTTTDASLSKMSACIVAYAPESDFPIQNLPYGVFSRHDSNKPHIGVAIGAFSFFFLSFLHRQ
jgi:hypothetical protein